MDPIRRAASWRALWIFIVCMLLLASLLAGFFRPSFMDVPSFFILAVTAYVAFHIYLVRRPTSGSSLRSQARIWLLVSIGFLYLALYEALSFHERIDFFIHWMFQAKETALSDRMDDLIVLLYGIIGLIILYFHRGEFWGFRRHQSLVVTGFGFLVIMVLMDVIGNRSDLLRYFDLNAEAAHRAQKWCELIEDTCKLAGECAFLIAFARVYDSYVTQIYESRISETAV